MMNLVEDYSQLVKIMNNTRIFTENSLIFMDDSAVELRIQVLIEGGVDPNTVWKMSKCDHAVTLMRQIGFHA